MQLRDNYFFVRPGDKAFLVSSNYTNYLELGTELGGGFFLIAEVDDGEFLVSGRLYDKGGHLVSVVRRNDAVTGGASIEYSPNGGYGLRTRDGELVFQLMVVPDRPNLRVLTGKFYDERGDLVAEGDLHDFRIYRGPAVIGKSGSSRGIVVRRAKVSPSR